MKKNTIKINESVLRQIVAESVKNVLKEDCVDTFAYIDDVVKKAYALRHAIHVAFDQCDYFADEQEGGNLSHKITNPVGYKAQYGGADDEIGKAFYDAYYMVNNLIKNLKSLSDKYAKELDSDLYGEDDM